MALVVAQGASNLMGARGTLLLSLVCVAYAVQAVTLWLLPRFQPLTAPLQQPGLRRRQWLATIGVDLLAFGTLHLVESGSNFNYGALLVLPVLMAGVMTPRLLALGTAAGVTLLLLLVGLARAVRRRRAAHGAAAVGAGRAGAVRHRAAGRRTGGPAGARGTALRAAAWNWRDSRRS